VSPRRRPPAAALLVVVLSALAAVLLQVAPAGAAPRQGNPGGVFHGFETPNPPGAPGEKVVSLTFDDGPQPTYTPRILDVLTHYGVRATFFEIGRQAEKHPDLVKAIVAQGSVVANHTWDHVSLRPLDDARFAFEVDHTTEILQAASGQHVLCLRPPYGSTDGSVAQRLGARGLATVLWTADSADFTKPGVDAIVQNAMDHLQPGGIILLHDGGGNRDQTVAALPIIIGRIVAAGYRIAPICAPDPHAPVGGLASATGEKGGRLSATGWASDPDSPDPIDVHLYLDGAYATAVKASDGGTPGPRWSTTIPARPGHHELCAFAINVGPPGANPKLGCATTDVPAITAFDDLRPLAAQARYSQLREQALVLERVVRVHDARTLPWRIRSVVRLGRPALAR
jgi:peptidoglycan/xylan/chitin deacetylase (PgdA/CDA1 family)